MGPSSFNGSQLISSNNIYFNLSHSGSWVICVVDNEPAAIDIEKI
jgi:4'-phosphopantetheinyl transferase